MLGIILIAYLFVGSLISLMLLVKASRAAEFKDLGAIEVLFGFLLHTIIWPLTIWLIISED